MDMFSFLLTIKGQKPLVVAANNLIFQFKSIKWKEVLFFILRSLLICGLSCAVSGHGSWVWTWQLDSLLCPMLLSQIPAIQELLVVFLNVKYPFCKRCDMYSWFFLLLNLQRFCFILPSELQLNYRRQTKVTWKKDKLITTMIDKRKWILLCSNYVTIHLEIPFYHFGFRNRNNHNSINC